MLGQHGYLLKEDEAEVNFRGEFHFLLEGLTVALNDPIFHSSGRDNILP